MKGYDMSAFDNLNELKHKANTSGISSLSSVELAVLRSDSITAAAELARLQAIEAAAREVLERFEWYKKLAEEGKGVSDSGYLSVSVMTLWDKQDQLAYDALAAALTQPGDGGEGG
jgi:hypothetical protein